VTDYSSEASGGAFQLITDVLIAPASRPAGHQRVRAVIDTGSDVSAVPEQFIRANGLVPTADQEIVFADGRTVIEPLFQVQLTLQSWQPVPVLVWAAPFETALVGLDVQQHGFLIADGPRGRFDLLWRETWRARLMRMFA